MYIKELNEKRKFMGRKRVKVRKRVRVVLILILIIVVILFVILFFVKVSRGVIEVGTMDFEQNNVEIVFVRDEVVETGASFGKIHYIADEGQVVNSGDVVATVYKSGYNENVLLDLITLQQNIKQYQIGTLRKDIADPEYNSIQVQIDQKLLQISEAIQSPQKNNLLVLQRELTSLLEQRREYLKKFQPDGQLTQLLSNEEEYLNLLQEWQDDVVAHNTGKISFYFDQYELLLNRKNLESGILSYADIQAVRQQKTLDLSALEANGTRSLYRLVTPDIFYCIITTNSNNYFSMVQGEKYNLSFSGFYDKVYEGQVILSTQNGDGYVYILQVQDDVTPFMNMRMTRATISASFTGMQVPTDALSKENNSYGLYVEQGNQRIFVPIDILAQDKKDTVFKVATSSNVSLMPGVSYVAKKYSQ